MEYPKIDNKIMKNDLLNFVCGVSIAHAIVINGTH